MKSIKERLAEKEKAKQKKLMARTGPTRFFTLALPNLSNYVITKGDMQYMAHKARNVFHKLSHYCPRYFIDELMVEAKRYINNRDNQDFIPYGEEKPCGLAITDIAGGHQTNTHFLSFTGRPKPIEIESKKSRLNKLNTALKTLLDYRFQLQKEIEDNTNYKWVNVLPDASTVPDESTLLRNALADVAVSLPDSNVSPTVNNVPIAPNQDASTLNAADSTAPTAPTTTAPTTTAISIGLLAGAIAEARAEMRASIDALTAPETKPDANNDSPEPTPNAESIKITERTFWEKDAKSNLVIVDKETLKANYKANAPMLIIDEGYDFILPKEPIAVPSQETTELKTQMDGIIKALDEGYVIVGELPHVSYYEHEVGKAILRRNAAEREAERRVEEAEARRDAIGNR